MNHMDCEAGVAVGIVSALNLTLTHKLDRASAIRFYSARSSDLEITGSGWQKISVQPNSSDGLSRPYR